jgi:hypothetical protein
MPWSGPPLPSISSLMMSAWPACWAVSAAIRTSREAQRGAALVLGPVRDPRGRVEVKLADDLVSVPAGAAVQAREVAAGLAGQRPHVGAVPDRAVLDPGKCLRPRAAERLTEVPVLQPGQVLD